jgi:hypothetical protein
MNTLDITSDELKAHGYDLKKEGPTVAVYRNNNGVCCTRSSIYKNDWNKTTKQLEKKLGDIGVPRLEISAILSCAASNYDKLIMNGSAASGTAADDATTTATTEAPPDKLNDISFDEWQTQLLQKHDALQDTIRSSVVPLPNLSLPLEFELSVKNVLNLADNTLPFAGFLLGPAGSLKTLTVERLRKHWHAFYKDDFNPSSWVSHYSGSTKEQLSENDMLPKVRFKCFLTPELAPLFGGSEDVLVKTFSNLTRILDGKGFESSSGTQGDRGYHGNYVFTWIGAVVDISSKVHRLMGNLGPNHMRRKKI